MRRSAHPSRHHLRAPGEPGWRAGGGLAPMCMTDADSCADKRHYVKSVPSRGPSPSGAHLLASRAEWRKGHSTAPRVTTLRHSRSDGGRPDGTTPLGLRGLGPGQTSRPCRRLRDLDVTTSRITDCPVATSGCPVRHPACRPRCNRSAGCNWCGPAKYEFAGPCRPCAWAVRPRSSPGVVPLRRRWPRHRTQRVRPRKV